ncbi:hypothetical protein RCJ22_20010 [Vibrio sp. FNV 38]|nr:hypothetical protein [Vibrio sp. FNV 38]
MNNSNSLTHKLSTLFNPQTRDMASYAVALFFMKGLSLIMLPIITRYLSPSEMGQLELLAVSGALLGILFSLALHEALYRFAGEAKGKKQQQIANDLFSLTLICSFVAGVTGLLTLWHFPWNPAWELDKTPVAILFGSLTIEGALAMSLAWLRMQNRAKVFSLICIVTSSLQVTLVILFLSMDWAIEGVLISGFIAHALQLAWVVKTTGLKIAMPSVTFIKKSLKYTAPIMLSSACAFGLNGAERWFILEGETFAMLGQYAIAAKFALAMCILVQPYGMWWMPKRFSMVESNAVQATRITEKGIAYVCVLAITVSLFGRWALELLLTDIYAPASQLLTGAIFMVLGKELCELVNLGLLKQKKSSILFYINFFTCITVLIGMSLTYQYGIWSIMLAIGIAQMMRAILIYGFSQRHFYLPYKVNHLCLIVTTTLLSLLFFTMTESVWAMLTIWLLGIITITITIVPDVVRRLTQITVFKRKAL